MYPTLEDTLRRVSKMYGTKALDVARLPGAPVQVCEAMHHWGNIVQALEIAIKQRAEAEAAREAKLHEEMERLKTLAEFIKANPIMPKDKPSWLYDVVQKSGLEKSARYQRSTGASSKYSATTKNAATSTSSTKKA